jgi:hypothetical protein
LKGIELPVQIGGLFFGNSENRLRREYVEAYAKTAINWRSCVWSA